MRVDLKFRHSEASTELQDYVQQRIDKLEKFELKPVRVEFTFSAEKTHKRVDIHVRGQDLELHAHSEAQDFYQGVDQVLAKIARQLARKKEKIQAHKVS